MTRYVQCNLLVARLVTSQRQLHGYLVFLSFFLAGAGGGGGGRELVLTLEHGSQSYVSSLESALKRLPDVKLPKQTNTDTRCILLLLPDIGKE